MFDAAITAAAAANPHRAEVLPMVPGLTLHLDGDYLAYYASGNDETDPGTARMNAISLIEEYRTAVGAENVVVHCTARGCHKGERYLVATVKPYQGHRVGGRKPKNCEYLQDWLHTYTGTAFRLKLWATREADDGIAACAHYAVGQSPGYAAIATADKDMRMLPGLHIDWVSRGLTRVQPGDYAVVGGNSKLYGLKWFWMQMLMGDTADNIPGLERYSYSPKAGGLGFKPCGEKTAETFLEDCGTNKDAAERVIALYQMGYPDADNPHVWADRFVEQAALLWMRCGNTAEVDDFATHAGHSRISQYFNAPILAAVKRLTQRVSIARTEIDSLARS